MCFFFILRSVELYLLTDVSGSTWSHKYHSQAVQDEYSSRAAWSLKLKSIDCPETPKTNYYSTLCKIPKDRNLIHTPADVLFFLPVPRKLTRNTETGKCVLFYLSFIDLRNGTFHFKRSMWMWSHSRNSQTLRTELI